jgi:hypothetical protein
MASDMVEQSAMKRPLEKEPQSITATSRDLAQRPTGSTQEHTVDNTVPDNTLDAENEASSPFSPTINYIDNFRIQPNISMNKKDKKHLFSHHAKNQLSQVLTTSSGNYKSSKHGVL